jgi:HAMP domain-containing protein
MKEDSIRYETALADTILRSMRHEMVRSDRGSLQAIISDIGELDRVEYVRVFKCTGVVSFSDNLEEINSRFAGESRTCIKCHQDKDPATRLDTMDQASTYINRHGDNIMSIVTPIRNDPGCTTSECHLKQAEKPLLGILDIGLTQTQMEDSLARLRLRMIVFCVMILILTVAGVTALLWRGVMQPLRELVDYASKCYEGKHEDDPPIGANEINHIGEILQKLAVLGSDPHAQTGEEDDSSPGDREED